MARPSHVLDPTMDVGDLVLLVEFPDPLPSVSFLAREASPPERRDERAMPVETLSYEHLLSALWHHTHHDADGLPFSMSRFDISASVPQLGTMQRVRTSAGLWSVVCAAVFSRAPRLSMTASITSPPVIRLSDSPVPEDQARPAPEPPAPEDEERAQHPLTTDEHLVAMDEEACTVLSQQTPSNLAAFKRFFCQTDEPRWPSAERGPTFQTHITGFKAPLHQFQLFAVWWSLHTVLGGPQYGMIIGDEMGLGKGPVAMGLWIVWCLLVRNHAVVAKSRRKEDGEHNPSGSDNPVCPSGWSEKHGIECSCVQGSAAEMWKAALDEVRRPVAGHPASTPDRLARNPWLFLVSKSNFQNWVQCYDKFVDPEPLGMYLLLGYGDLSGDLKARQLKEETNKAAILDGEIRHKQRFGILTTHQSYETQVASTKDALKGTCPLPGWNRYSVVVPDEFHEHARGTAGPATIVKNADCRAVICLSGTPYSSDKKNIGGWFPLLLRTDAQIEGNLSDLGERRHVVEQINNAAAQYSTSLHNFINTLNSEKGTAAEMDTLAKHRRNNATLTQLLQPYLIRRMKTTKWADGTISPLHPIKTTFVRTELSVGRPTEQPVELARNLEGGPITRTDFQGIARAAVQQAMFPGISLLLPRAAQVLTYRHMHDQGWVTSTYDGDDSVVAEKIYDICKGSSKCAFVKNQVQACAPLEDCGVLEKLLIGSVDPTNAFLMFRYLKATCPDKRIGQIHSATTQSKRGEIIKQFKARPGDEGGHIDVLVVSIKLISTGLDLNAYCRRMIILEPSLRLDLVEQFKNRLSREGCVNRHPEATILVHPDGPEVMTWFKQQAQQSEFAAEITISDLKNEIQTATDAVQHLQTIDAPAV